MMSAKDLLRNHLTGFSLLFMFGFYLALMFLIQASFTINREIPVVAVSAPTNTAERTITEAITHQLARYNIETLPETAQALGQGSPQTPAPANILVLATNSTVTLLLDADAKPVWSEVWRAVRDAGLSDAQVSVVNTEGEAAFDVLRINLGSALALGFMAIAFVGTTVPLVSMRENGTLRLIGTTPLPRATLLLSQLPVRVALASLEAAAIVAISTALNFIAPGSAISLIITMITGLVMLFGLAMLFAVKARSAEATQQTMAMIPMVFIGIAGGIFPVSILPGFVQTLFNAVPTTWLTVALNADLAGTTPFTDICVLWVLMLGTGAAAFFLAARHFDWDSHDEDSKPHPQALAHTSQNG